MSYLVLCNVPRIIFNYCLILGLFGKKKTCLSRSLLFWPKYIDLKLLCGHTKDCPLMVHSNFGRQLYICPNCTILRQYLFPLSVILLYIFWVFYVMQKYPIMLRSCIDSYNEVNSELDTAIVIVNSSLC